ncbi:HAD-IB family hydrolase [Streptomyces sp. NPDC052109]|uniref:HAD family hydrolase n=1 Tax=Streptomyces sp. NPDC052109 TaxID=3155527 RepID=UPI00344AECE6
MESSSFTHAAFFDVDETLITVKSMFAFRRHWLAAHGDDDGGSFAAEWAETKARADAGVDRIEINRAYYRRFAGVPRAELFAAGRAWYEEYRRGADAFVSATVRAAARHRADGHAVVLVSGSFRGVLDPLAEELGAHLVLCSEPAVDEHGVLTGAVPRPMIGPNKALGVREVIAGLGLRPEDCFAYGDHSSDLEMLSLVGAPRVVGADPVLTEHARRAGWTVLSAATGPAPAGAPA